MEVTGYEEHDAIIEFTVNARSEPSFITAPLSEAKTDRENPVVDRMVSSEAVHYLMEINQLVDFSDRLNFSGEITDNILQLPKALQPCHFFWWITSVLAFEHQGRFIDSIGFRVPFPGPSPKTREVDNFTGLYDKPQLIEIAYATPCWLLLLLLPLLILI